LCQWNDHNNRWKASQKYQEYIEEKEVKVQSSLPYDFEELYQDEEASQELSKRWDRIFLIKATNL